MGSGIHLSSNASAIGQRRRHKFLYYEHHYKWLYSVRWIRSLHCNGWVEESRTAELWSISSAISTNKQRYIEKFQHIRLRLISVNYSEMLRALSACFIEDRNISSCASQRSSWRQNSDIINDFFKQTHVLPNSAHLCFPKLQTAVGQNRFHDVNRQNPTWHQYYNKQWHTIQHVRVKSCILFFQRRHQPEKNQYKKTIF